MCTNPSRDRDGSILPTLMLNLVMYQNTCFAIQASPYSTLDQRWDGSIRHERATEVYACSSYLLKAKEEGEI